MDWRAPEWTSRICRQGEAAQQTPWTSTLAQASRSLVVQGLMKSTVHCRIMILTS